MSIPTPVPRQRVVQSLDSRFPQPALVGQHREVGRDFEKPQATSTVTGELI